MNQDLHRLRILAYICFFPLALIADIRIKLIVNRVATYQASVSIFLAFLVGLASYTYGMGGRFIAPMATFY